MAGKKPARHSILKRITLIVLLIFVVSIWALSYYASRMLRDDMQRLLGEQQFSTVSFVAAGVNSELQSRINALELIARAIDPALLNNRPALQEFLNHRFVLHSQFNAGVFALSHDGTAIADVSQGVERIGTNYADYDAVRAALDEGKSLVGQPKIGRRLPAPVFTIVAPIRNAQGKVIGALAGTTDLSKPNFLDRITENRYGKTGGYLLVAPQFRLIVTATDKSRIMETLPAPGVNPSIDRFIQGYEGSAVVLTPRGVEVLASTKRVPVAGWHVAALLPTAEAFSPIRDMQQGILLATAFLTLLAGTLTWWLLRRELSPLGAAVERLAAMSATGQALQPLQVVKPDEIGELIGGFNHLLESLRQREEALKESEFRWKFAIEGSGDGLWDWNIADSTVFLTPRWKEMLGFAENEIGDTLDEWKKHIHPEDKMNALATVQDYLNGKTPVYSCEHRVLCKDGSYKWMLDRGIVVSRDDDGKPLRMIGTHTDITERKHAEAKLAQSESHLRTIIENEPECIKIIDAQGRLVQMNPAGLAMIEADSLEQVSMRPVLDFIAPEYRSAYAKLHKRVIAGETMQMKYEVLGFKGGRRWLETHAVPMQDHGVTVHLAVTRDISERKQAEMALEALNQSLEQRIHEETARNMAQERLLIQQSRLAAMGEMIGNIAHQWRQPINALTLLLANIKDAYEYNDLTKEFLDQEVEIGQNLIQKMSDTIDDFRNFFKPSKEKQRFIACDSAEEAVKLVSHSFMNSNIEITHEKSAKPCAVLGYPNEFAQVVLNALTNAKEAIANRKIAGKVHLKVERGEDTAAVIIRDNGGGIPEEIMGKVFDPYFTTKAAGTGIGLYMSKMIMDNMGGSIAIRNIEGGVEVLLMLPLDKQIGA